MLKKMISSLASEMCERFWNFEALNGWIVMIPWGAGFIYCGLYDLKFGYQYSMVSVGAVLVLWGLRKGTVNRIKYWNKIEEMQQRRKQRES